MRRRWRATAAFAVIVAATFVFAPALPARGPLSPGGAQAAAPGLRIGDRGPDVTWLQLRLASLGLFRAAATGYFGPVTEAAVRSYQRQVGIAVSGVVGPQTCARLLAEPWKVKVARGDTLAAIAARYQVSVAALWKANPQVVNANRIYAGQNLVIPGTERIVAIAGPGAGPAAVPASGQALAPESAPGAEAATGGGTQVAPQQAVYGRIVPGAGVLLTFDGGPDPEVLPLILDVLRRQDCRAVFFFCGENMAVFPELVRAVDAEGHCIASHGWQNESLVALMETKITADLQATAKLIADLTGKQPLWFRPPKGELCAAVVCSARRTGHQLVMWQNIGALPDGPDTVERIDRYLSEATAVRLPGTGTLVLSYLEALIQRWKAHGVKMLAPADLGRSPAVW